MFISLVEYPEFRLYSWTETLFGLSAFLKLYAVIVEVSEVICALQSQDGLKIDAVALLGNPR